MFDHGETETKDQQNRDEISHAVRQEENSHSIIFLLDHVQMLLCDHRLSILADL